MTIERNTTNITILAEAMLAKADPLTLLDVYNEFLYDAYVMDDRSFQEDWITIHGARVFDFPG